MVYTEMHGEETEEKNFKSTESVLTSRLLVTLTYCIVLRFRQTIDLKNYEPEKPSFAL